MYRKAEYIGEEERVGTDVDGGVAEMGGEGIYMCVWKRQA